jgi:hypothetical protein
MGHGTAGSNASVVSCPVCAENVSGLRFAPHLEKCLNGGKRGSKRHYDCLQDEGLGKSPKKVHKNMDPFPNSLIVRFKMKGGGEQLASMYNISHITYYVLRVARCVLRIAFPLSLVPPFRVQCPRATNGASGRDRRTSPVELYLRGYQRH